MRDHEDGVSSEAGDARALMTGSSLQRKAVKYLMVDTERGAMAGEEAEWHGL